MNPSKESCEKPLESGTRISYLERVRRMAKETPQEVKLTPGKMVRLKDRIGNTLGMMKLDGDGHILLYPAKPCKVWDKPITEVNAR